MSGEDNWCAESPSSQEENLGIENCSVRWMNWTIDQPGPEPPSKIPMHLGAMVKATHRQFHPRLRSGRTSYPDDRCLADFHCVSWLPAVPFVDNSARVRRFTFRCDELPDTEWASVPVDSQIMRSHSRHMFLVSHDIQGESDSSPNLHNLRRYSADVQHLFFRRCAFQWGSCDSFSQSSFRTRCNRPVCYRCLPVRRIPLLPDSWFRISPRPGGICHDS